TVAQSSRESTAPPDAAPLIAPDGITPETPIERPDPNSPTIPGFTSGVPNSWGLGVERVPPPPPPPPPTQGPVHLSSGMQAPRKLVNVDPVYPRVAQIAHVAGVVILDATIDAHGRVVDVRGLRSVAMPDQAAVEAVR